MLLNSSQDFLTNADLFSPDSRWSPRLSPELDVLSSGELLYFTSGFLTLQLEIQNYFSFLIRSNVSIKTSIFPQLAEIILADEFIGSKYQRKVQ